MCVDKHEDNAWNDFISEAADIQRDEDILAADSIHDILLSHPSSKPLNLAVLKWKLRRNVNLISQIGDENQEHV